MTQSAPGESAPQNHPDQLAFFDAGLHQGAHEAYPEESDRAARMHTALEAAYHASDPAEKTVPSLEKPLSAEEEQAQYDALNHLRSEAAQAGEDADPGRERAMDAIHRVLDANDVAEEKHVRAEVRDEFINRERLVRGTRQADLFADDIADAAQRHVEETLGEPEHFDVSEERREPEPQPAPLTGSSVNIDELKQARAEREAATPPSANELGEAFRNFHRGFAAPSEQAGEQAGQQTASEEAPEVLNADEVDGVPVNNNAGNEANDAHAATGTQEASRQTASEAAQQPKFEIEVGSAHKMVTGFDRVLIDQDSRTYAIAAGLGATEQDGEAAQAVSEAVESYFAAHGSDITAENAGIKMTEAFNEAFHRVKQAHAEGHGDEEMATSATVLHVFENGDGTYGAVVGSIGDTRLLRQEGTGNDIELMTTDEVDEADGGLTNYLSPDTDELQLNQVHVYPTITHDTRFILHSVGVTGGAEPTPNEYLSAFGVDDEQKAADVFANLNDNEDDDKSVIVIDISHEVGAVPQPAVGEAETHESAGQQPGIHWNVGLGSFVDAAGNPVPFDEARRALFGDPEPAPAGQNVDDPDANFDLDGLDATGLGDNGGEAQDDAETGHNDDQDDDQDGELPRIGGRMHYNEELKRWEDANGNEIETEDERGARLWHGNLPPEAQGEEQETQIAAIRGRRARKAMGVLSNLKSQGAAAALALLPKRAANRIMRRGGNQERSRAAAGAAVVGGILATGAAAVLSVKLGLHTDTSSAAHLTGITNLGQPRGTLAHDLLTQTPAPNASAVERAARGVQAAKEHLDSVTIKPGGNAWSSAQELLARRGNAHPTNPQIQAMAAELLKSQGINYNDVDATTHMAAGTVLTAAR